eukprot:9160114-Ditylum_brightwellii.AAC.1
MGRSLYELSSCLKGCSFAISCAFSVVDVVLTCGRLPDSWLEVCRVDGDDGIWDGCGFARDVSIFTGVVAGEDM